MPLLNRDASIWKEGAPWVRDAGVWKAAKNAYVRDAGVWKEFFRSGFDTSIPKGTFIEGGYYLGTVTDGGVLYALILAPKSGEGTATRFGYGGTYTAFSTTNGPANTTSIIANDGGPFHAPIYCANYSANGFSDWYLAASDEWKSMMANAGALPSGQELQSGGNNRYYWSSTEVSTSNAYAYLAGNSSTDYSRAKGDSYSYRPVRRVVAST